jgi:translation initiation factor 1
VTARIVFSTGGGRSCSRCGWPAADCHCASSLVSGQEPIPETVIARLRLENRASGKSVTIVDGLPSNLRFLESLARELKKSCGTGGPACEQSIELQGDQRDRLRELLVKKGWTVKG